jgi:hypothetical protein
MSAPEEAVRLGECERCGDLILVVRSVGLTTRLARWTVPANDAEVLERYGVAVYRLARSGRWMYATERYGDTPSQMLVTTHICGIDPRRKS